MFVKLGSRELSRGVGLLEVLIVVGLVTILTGLAVFQVYSSLDSYRASGDARSIASRLMVAKLLAGKKFTRTQVRISPSQDSLVLEVWDRTASKWVIEVGPVILSRGVQFGAGPATEPPPDIADLKIREPILFNSRGLPVDSNGNPVTNYSLFLNDGKESFAISVSVGGRITTWRLLDKGWTEL